MAFLRSFGHWLPARIVANEEIGGMLGCDADWIRGVSGIEERRFGDEDESVVQMAVAAARQCLEAVSLAAKDVGYLICSSGTAARMFPGPAVEVARELGCGEIPAIDLPIASAGSLVALDLAQSLAARYGHVLVVASEKMSSVALRQPMERGVSMLFGDGAGACLVSSDTGSLEIVDSMLCADGQYADDLALSFSAPLSMNGRSVILQASRKIPRVIADLLERHQLLPEGISAYLMHQANLNLIHKVANALELPRERFFTNIARYGNTSSASLLIAASEWWSTTPLRPEEKAVFTVFGAGFHWGAMLLRAV